MAGRAVEVDLEAVWGDRLWRGDRLGRRLERVLPTGHPVLDRELPGGGWPAGALTEVLLPVGAGCEWRLLMPALGRLLGEEGAARTGSPRGAVVMIGAPTDPRSPCAAGLGGWGLDPARLVRVVPRTAQDALWATEQALQCPEVAAVLAWLPQARPAALRRLQVHAQRGQGFVFLFRPEAAARESSPAPLRVQVAPGGVPWSLQLRLLKRRGPVHEGVLELAVLPPGLARVLGPKLRQRAALAGTPAAARPVIVPSPSSLPLERTDAVLVRADRALHVCVP